MDDWQVAFPEPNRAELVNQKIPQPGTDEVLTQTECSLISSGTEMICLRGTFAKDSHWGAWVRYPWYPGCQNIGVVRAVGSAVTRLQVGQRVATHSSHSRYVTAPARRCIIVPEPVGPESIAAVVQSYLGYPAEAIGERAAELSIL
jgi:NADPH:quinone reductase-like Zn-dependent oxidoreductase